MFKSKLIRIFFVISFTLINLLPALAETNFINLEPVLTQQEWTYIRIVDYDGVWGDNQPSLQTVEEGHLPFSTVKGVNYVLLGDAYGNTGSLYGYVLPNGKRLSSKINEIDMGNLSTYSEFFDWVVRNFPAKNYVLSYWGHGGGAGFSIGALGYDQTSPDGGGLTPDDIKEMVASLTKKTKKNLSVLFLCTCLNAMAELAWPIKDDVDYLIAGETVVGCQLEPYEILKKEISLTSRQLADKTIESFNPQAEDVVYSSIQLKSMTKFGDLLSNISSTLINEMEKDSTLKNLIIESVARVQNMGDYTQPTLFDTYVDIVDLMETFKSLNSKKISNIAEEIQLLVKGQLITKMVLKNGTEKKYARAHGLSIVHPHSDFSYIPMEYYFGQSFSSDTGWGNYLSHLLTPDDNPRILVNHPLDLFEHLALPIPRPN